jgi:DNA adenine methylase
MGDLSPIKRPALRWHGGKFLLAPWIISHFPKHKVYVEPFGGAMSVLLRKARSYAEIYNDLDDDVVNLFRVLREKSSGDALVSALRLTPFAREEFNDAYHQSPDSVERARQLVIRSFMGFGSNGHSRVTGFRANSNRTGTTPAHDWVNIPESLKKIINRMSGVVIEHKDAKAVMAQHDSPDTLHYVDPPYMFSTRADSSKDYTHEMTDADHAEMLAFLQTLEGMVMLSGYPHPMYEASLSGWTRSEKQALADGAKKRTEVLWMNERAAVGRKGSLI